MKIAHAIAFAAMLGASVTVTPVIAADVYVISHPAVDLSADDIRDVFVGEKQIAGGTKLVPMDNASLQKDFLEKVVKIDASKYSAVWTKKGFRDGLNPPQVKSGDAEAISAVKATPGAVSYVSSAPQGVKVIRKY